MPKKRTANAAAVLAAALVACGAALGRGQTMSAPAERGALNLVEKRVVDAVSSGRPAVVILDIDDTLTRTYVRKYYSLMDVLREPEVLGEFPEEAAAVSNLSLEQAKGGYGLDDIASAAGVENPGFIKKIAPPWLAIFLSAKYLPLDPAVPGAASYVSLLYSKGATLVYLTGRDAPNMGQATRASLKRLGFPLDEPRTQLLLKPNAEMTDLDFKKLAFDQISSEGEPVAAFENEPANLNAMTDRFPGITAVLLNTTHSNAPVEPYPSTALIDDFRR